MLQKNNKYFYNAAAKLPGNVSIYWRENLNHRPRLPERIEPFVMLCLD